MLRNVNMIFKRGHLLVYLVRYSFDILVYIFEGRIYLFFDLAFIFSVAVTL